MRIIWKITTIRAIAVLLCYLCDANLRGFAQHRRAHDSRPIAVTFAPQAASASTIASPSPWLPPVMTTRFPFRFCMFILLTRASGVVVVDDVVGEAVERGERCDLRVVSDHIGIGSHRFQTILEFVRVHGARPIAAPRSVPPKIGHKCR